jgi:eukaryotic-like serine/threonine-protein kinase
MRNWPTYGYSWGAEMGGIIPAVEPRIKVCVLALVGFDFQRPLPAVDTINFVSRVKQPVLMLNGRYDFFYPVQSSQEPFFQLLGSRNDQKKTDSTTPATTSRATGSLRKR